MSVFLPNLSPMLWWFKFPVLPHPRPHAVVGALTQGPLRVAPFFSRNELANELTKMALDRM